MPKRDTSLTSKPIRRVYSYFNPPPDVVGSISTDESATSMTMQSFKDECDINNIVAKYMQTGILGDPLAPKPFYGDFSSVPSYREALDLIFKVDEHFDSLPSGVRARFDNDPEQLLNFLNNPDNRDEAIKLGLCAPQNNSDSVANPDPITDSSQSAKD